MPEIITSDVLFFFDGHPGALSLYEALAARLLAEFPATEIRVQKTQISFYDGRVYACASLAKVLPRARRPEPFLTVSFSLDRALDVPRALAIQVRPNRYTHHVVIGRAGEIDGELTGWLRLSHGLGCR